MQVDDGKMKHDFAKGLSLHHHSFEHHQKYQTLED